MPMREGLTFVHDALVGAGLRDKVRIGCSGKILTAFDMARAMALGADWCNSARGFMFSLGCIQSLSCHTDTCPTGVATQDPWRGRAIHVPDKIERVANFHRATLHCLAELTAAAGLDHPEPVRPRPVPPPRFGKQRGQLRRSFPRDWKRASSCAARAIRALAALWDKASADYFSPPRGA